MPRVTTVQDKGIQSNGVSQWLRLQNEKYELSYHICVLKVFLNNSKRNLNGTPAGLHFNSVHSQVRKLVAPHKAESKVLARALNQLNEAGLLVRMGSLAETLIGKKAVGSARRGKLLNRWSLTLEALNELQSVENIIRRNPSHVANLDIDGWSCYYLLETKGVKSLGFGWPTDSAAHPRSRNLACLEKLGCRSGRSARGLKNIADERQTSDVKITGKSKPIRVKTPRGQRFGNTLKESIQTFFVPGAKPSSQLSDFPQPFTFDVELPKPLAQRSRSRTNSKKRDKRLRSSSSSTHDTVSESGPSLHSQLDAVPQLAQSSSGESQVSENGEGRMGSVASRSRTKRMKMQPSGDQQKTLLKSSAEKNGSGCETDRGSHRSSLHAPDYDQRGERLGILLSDVQSVNGSPQRGRTSHEDSAYAYCYPAEQRIIDRRLYRGIILPNNVIRNCSQHAECHTTKRSHEWFSQFDERALNTSCRQSEAFSQVSSCWNRLETLQPGCGTSEPTCHFGSDNIQARNRVQRIPSKSQISTEPTSPNDIQPVALRSPRCFRSVDSAEPTGREGSGRYNIFRAASEDSSTPAPRRSDCDELQKTGRKRASSSPEEHRKAHAFDLLLYLLNEIIHVPRPSTLISNYLNGSPPKSVEVNTLSKLEKFMNDDTQTIRNLEENNRRLKLENNNLEKLLQAFSATNDSEISQAVEENIRCSDRRFSISDDQLDETIAPVSRRKAHNRHDRTDDEFLAVKAGSLGLTDMSFTQEENDTSLRPFQGQRAIAISESFGDEDFARSVSPLSNCLRLGVNSTKPLDNPRDGLGNTSAVYDIDREWEELKKEIYSHSSKTSKPKNKYANLTSQSPLAVSQSQRTEEIIHLLKSALVEVQTQWNKTLQFLKENARSSDHYLPHVHQFNEVISKAIRALYAGKTSRLHKDQHQPKGVKCSSITGCRQALANRTIEFSGATEDLQSGAEDLIKINEALEKEIEEAKLDYKNLLRAFNLIERNLQDTSAELKSTREQNMKIFALWRINRPGNSLRRRGTFPEIFRERLP